MTVPGLKASEGQAILNLLRRFRLVRIDQPIADEYSQLRANHSSLAKGDALIAASALVRRIPLSRKTFGIFARPKGWCFYL